MESFQVGFYTDVFKNDAFDFEGCNSIEASDAEGAAEEFAEDAYHSRDMWEYGDRPWDKDDHSIIVKDKDGNISRFSVYTETEIVVKCDEIAL